MRDVYPGFLQLHGFMSMNLDRHIEAHHNLFLHLVKGDGDSAQKHREFYDEYLAVMDLAAEFYLQTVDTVFIRHALPKGEMTHRGRRVDPAAIKRVALMTVEGENDDISGVGQTEAAHALCVEYSGRGQGALRAARRRPLRRVQRLALPRRDRAAHRRFRAVAQRCARCARRRAEGRRPALISRSRAVVAHCRPASDSGSIMSIPLRALLFRRTSEPIGNYGRIRRRNLSGARAPPSAGAPLYAAHPCRQPRSRAHHAAARQREAGEGICAKARRRGSRRG